MQSVGKIMNTLTAPLGGLLGAMLGGVLWAKYIQWTGNTAGFIALGIGMLTGVGMLLTSYRVINLDKKVSLFVVSIAAALFAVIGIFIGKYLDVQWNAVAQITEQLIQAQNLSPEQATPIAETVFAGSSVWELMQHRMAWIDLLYGAVAAFIAFRIPAFQWLRNFLPRVP